MPPWPLQGTYALVGMALVLHAKLHALAAMPAAQVAAVLMAAHTASRWTSLPLLYCCAYIQVGRAAAAAAPLLLRGPRLVCAQRSWVWTICVDVAPSPTCLPACLPLQDEEDAKRGLYNWFAQSRALLTLPRLLLGTATAFAAPVLLLGAARGALVAATTLAVTLASGYYGNAIIGGVVGDYLGATIQVGDGRGRRLACWPAIPARHGWFGSRHG
jgi:cobalamin synthase